MRPFILNTIALLALAAVQVNADINFFSGTCSNIQSIAYNPSIASATQLKVTQADWIIDLFNNVNSWFGVS